jgi:hypothetical protein
MQLPAGSDGVVHPGIDSPNFDVTEGQIPTSSVWFLGAPFGVVRRGCLIPPEKWLFVALVNIESSNLEGEPFFGETAQDQASIAKYFADHIVHLFCEIDGAPVPDLPSYRISTPQFNFNAPTPWIFGDVGGPGTSSADGYYVLIKPLDPGQHILHFGGAFEFTAAADDFDLYAPLDMTYYITVP